MLSNQLLHHGAFNGVTGSCHEFKVNDNCSLLVDCGLFQGADRPGDGIPISKSPTDRTGRDRARSNGIADDQSIQFPITHIKALLLTHCHIDHVGRLPWLLIAGYRGPIYCTEATAHLLPLVIEDALRVGMTRNGQLIGAVKNRIAIQLRPVAYDRWETIDVEQDKVQLRFRQAGHILGSSYIEIELSDGRRVVFSGDLGCKNTPLLPDPTPLERADLLVLESTYGNRNHEARAERQQRLQAVIEHCVENRGAVLIPAFSIGRTQELLYELEDIIHRQGANNPAWQDIQVILDSPMAAKFTEQYQRMRELWDNDAKQRLASDRHPLDFERLHTIDSHDQHANLVGYLRSSAAPCIVIAASGMCAGGRIVNYLKALLSDPRTDVLFVGYQARGTPGADIQKYGPRGGYVVLEGERIDIKAQIHTLGGYSAHADQNELLDFVGAAVGQGGVGEVRLVHGEDDAKHTLATALQEKFNIEIS
ncbi:MBL fold hydrolase [Aliidiomarina sedimenti]|uniref:MBL fold hydrolase n=1 Tax=Aliidiomarina sedimenti TaxID=1933879 RepID=A0ABY0BZ78_9GAMM|nr:MBL fold metallo-hydrolase [Aliidiomarina sedimenti]RUO29990.1 MBL fold hydrolase [Aliidiomarina sedimenti]